MFDNIRTLTLALIQVSANHGSYFWKPVPAQHPLCCGSKSQVLSTSFWQGLHFYRLSEAQSRLGRVSCLPNGAKCAIFSTVLTFLYLRSQFLLARRGISRSSEGSRGVPRGSEEQSRGGGSGLSPERGLISREISGSAFRGEPSDFRKHF